MTGYSSLAALVIGAVALNAHQAAAFTVYVSNEKDNSISIIDSDSLSVVDTIKVGQRPRGILLTKDGSQLLICASDDDTVQVMDVASKEIVKTLPSGPDPELFILHPSGSPLYIANEDDNLVTVIDLENDKVLAEVPVGVEPEGMGLNPEIGGTVSVIDPSSRKIIQKISFEIPGVRPEAIQPVGVRVTKDGAKAFVALGPANRVAVVNAKTFEVEKFLLVGQRVWQLAFTPDESQLYTTNGVSNDVSVIDVAKLKVTKSIAVGRFPWGIVIAED